MSTAVARRPRPVLSVTEHEHRSLAVADGVLAGRFTVAGETRALGTDPDWLGADLPADEEWRIEWVKFAWGLDLAHAAERTGDGRYQNAWERLTASWIAQVPPGADAAEVTARRVLNWVYAWQRFAPPPEHETLLLLSLAEQVGHVRERLAPGRNHRTLELYALLVAALALPELDRDGLRDFAVAELDRNLADDFRADGVHREASTHYHLIALRSLVGARVNGAAYGVPFPAGFDERLARACAFAMHCTRPDGTIPALSDADTGDYGRLLLQAADVLGDDELRHVGSRGRAGRAPAVRDASFPDGGYHVQRSGWDPGARFLIFDCGPLGDGGHGHYDLLSFEAHAGGRPLVVDPGRGSYSEEPPNLRRWFRGTAAHNTVCVDGLDQTPYTRKRPRGPVAHGRLLERRRAPGLDVLAGEATSPAYEAVHRRRIAFVRGAFWVIEDRLHGEREHFYDLRFHLAPGVAAAVHEGVTGAPGVAAAVHEGVTGAPGVAATVHEGVTGAPGVAAAAGGSVVVAPGLALVIAGAEAVELQPGWVAPRYGEILDAPVVSAVAVGMDARFVSVLVPGGRVPRLSVEGDRIRVDGEAIDL